MRLIRVTALLLALVLMAGIPGAIGAGLIPYDTYNYDFFRYIVFTPAAYVPGESVTGGSLGIDAFNNAQGMYVAHDGTVYIADTNNNRIVVLEPDLRSVRTVIETFDMNGHDGPDKFNRPHGVALSDDGRIYVADTNNRRVVGLDGTTVFKIIKDPRSEMLATNFDFVPLKVAVDFAGRVFVIGRNMFQGIMTFDVEGNFIGFYGTISVTITLWQRFWRFFSTQAQREGDRLFIPTEFTGLDVDRMGFIYASNIDNAGTQAARRLNPTGEDVIRTGENNNLGGDLHQWPISASDFSGPSQIIDVVYRGHGMYSLLDRHRGRIFTYDHEGNLLYIFGGMGIQAGTFQRGGPAAIGAQEGRILALDAMRNELIVFEQTRYGELINRAVSLRFDGEEALAVDAWREVLLIHETFELANAGIGKAYLTAGDNESALHYLRLGMDRRHYAIAFRRHRNDVLRDNIQWIFTVGFILIVGFTAWRIVRRRKSGNVSEGGLS